MKARLMTRKAIFSLGAVGVMAINGNAAVSPVSDTYRYFMSRTEQEIKSYGRWDMAQKDSTVNAIHAALLPTGKVLLVAGSGNNQKMFDSKTFKTTVWNPNDNTFKPVDTPADLFCSGHAYLPDGKLLIAGGTKDYEDLNAKPKQDYKGLKDSFLFNPWTEKYERVDSLNFARWYPTLVHLPNGDILASSGLDDKGQILNGETEVFDHTTHDWVNRPDLTHYFPTYPTLILGADGRLFFTGSNAGYGPVEKGRIPGFWDIVTNTFTEVKGLEDANMTETSTSVLLPPAQDQKVMIMGGGGVGDSQEATSRTAIIDLDSANPHYEAGPDLKNPTRYPNAVILPDDTVLETGGSKGYRKDNLFSAEIYHPDTNTFTKAADPWVGRNYHTEALLLPDGRVATFGSNPIDNSFEMRIEIYSPAYFFNGERPSIATAPLEAERGESIEIYVNDPKNVKTAKLMRPSAVTHATDVEQRSVALGVEVGEHDSPHVHTIIPTNAALLPSGWYMLFVTDNNNLPSQARWIHIR